MGPSEWEDERLGGCGRVIEWEGEWVRVSGRLNDRLTSRILHGRTSCRSATDPRSCDRMLHSSYPYPASSQPPTVPHTQTLQANDTHRGHASCPSATRSRTQTHWPNDTRHDHSSCPAPNGPRSFCRWPIAVCPRTDSPIQPPVHTSAMHLALQPLVFVNATVGSGDGTLATHDPVLQLPVVYCAIKPPLHCCAGQNIFLHVKHKRNGK